MSETTNINETTDINDYADNMFSRFNPENSEDFFKSQPECNLTPALKNIIDSIAKGEMSIADFLAAQTCILERTRCPEDVIKINKSIYLVLVYLITLEQLNIQKLESACNCEKCCCSK